jgi:hypothetical protein
MFNPERLLGSMLSGAMGGGYGRSSNSARRSGGMGMGTQAPIGLSLLGIAIEAIEHFSNQQSAPQPQYGAAPPVPPQVQSQVPPPLPGAFVPGPSAPPPIPGASAGPGSSAPPQLPAGTAAPLQQAPPVPGVQAPAPTPEHSDSILLIRSMIAAAYADGTLDETERGKIMGKLSGLSEEDRQFILKELESPKDIDSIIAAVNSPALAQQVYAVSLMAIVPDNQAEYDYLKTLARRLYLSDAMVARIHQELGFNALG